MGELVLALGSDSLRRQLEYAAWFVDEHVQAVSVRENSLVVEFSNEADEKTLRTKLDRLVTRFTQMDEIEVREVFRTSNNSVVRECYPELVDRGWIVELARGVVTVRGLALELLEFLDDAFVREIAAPAGARHEYYPSVMTTERAQRSNHLTSFPEHAHFVCHLREDLDLLDTFAKELKVAGGWKPELLAKLVQPMATPAFVLNPSVCYNCYASLENRKLDSDGIVVTARSRCHRFESGNHRTLSRLLDFSMREVIYVGQPDYVKRERQRSIDLLRALVERWQIATWLETANDPFFTSDYEVKAAFQRQHDMKYELRMPLAMGSVAVGSSNFHSVTFGKAFQITSNGRPVCTGCIGFGLERWIYALFSQVGLNPESWPAPLRTDFERWRATHA